eukprot:jgi/Chrzof1/5662/Cz16g10190.t1
MLTPNAATSALFRSAPEFCAQDAHVRHALDLALPKDNAYTKCSNVSFIQVSVVNSTGGEDSGELVGPYTSREDLVNTTATSAYLPNWSGIPSYTIWRGQKAYDGGYTNPLPCPPGVDYCIKVSVFYAPPNATQNYTAPPAASNATDQLKMEVAQLLTSVNRIVTPVTVHPTADALQTVPMPDIAPGMFQPLPYSNSDWSSWALHPPNVSIFQSIYQLGQQDAALWARQHLGINGVDITTTPPAIVSTAGNGSAPGVGANNATARPMHIGGSRRLLSKSSLR